MISGPVSTGILMDKFPARYALAYIDCLEDRTVREPPAADIVYLAAPGLSIKMVEGGHQVA
jgi:hypothetical protein